VFDVEIAGLVAVRDGLSTEFEELVKLSLQILDGHGKLVFCGIGKSGHIGQKLAATLSSTGSRAAFLHPVEAMHGDLGILAEQDALLALSYSGETDELLAVLPAAKRLGAKIVGITGSPDSRLAGWADLVVPMPVPREACPFNLAPTTSTTALLALGDALAMVLLECREFELNDYAKLHPAGAIGRSITLGVADIMRQGEAFPTVAPDLPVREVLVAMTQARSGSVAVVAADRTLLGIFTDGDFRRHIMENADLLDCAISEVMTPQPITVHEKAMAVELVRILEQRKIDDIIVVDDENRAVGLVDIQDLPRFKVM
jgi:arabinose-5-phosphate isomerase